MRLPTFLATWAVLFLVLHPAAAKEGGPGEGTDIEIGGPGEGNGKFLELSHIAFDAKGGLYVLDGRRMEQKNNQKTWVGNLLVQRFDSAGKFLDQFPVKDDALGDKNQPKRLAIDSRGNVYVTEPLAGQVRQFAPDGKPLKSISIPGAYAIAARGSGASEQIIVAANLVEKNKPVSVGELQVIDPAGTLAAPIKLEKPITNCQCLAADAQGNIYAQADANQIYKFDPAGKLLTVIGGGTSRRLEDGSELRESVAVDAKGNIYSWAWNRLAIFDPAVSTVATKVGQFYWYDNWSVHGSYVAMAIDPTGRLWLGAVGNADGAGRYHFRPAVVRTKADFLKDAKSANTLCLGLDPAILTPDLPQRMSCELKPVNLEFAIKPAYRRVKDVSVEYRVYDIFKNELAKDRFDLKLEDGVEAKKSLSFTPPKWGWYTIECQLYQGSTRLMGVGGHLGFTPKFAGLPTLPPVEANGGCWNDIARTAFCGLSLHRINASMPPKDIAAAIQQAEKFRVILMFQFTSKADCDPAKVKAIVSKFSPWIKHWEVINEPNLGMKPEDYAKLFRDTKAVIRAIDKDAHVMGPAVCGINLKWLEEFYKADGKHCDVFTVHDYEGNESVDPGHWAWKIGELKKLMKKNGDDKPIWQTERGIPGIRGNTFLGGAQAVRIMLQRDVLETLGIPSEHNFYYYVNAAGFGAYPAYIWGPAGPHPAALTLRTREAMIHGKTLHGTLDFGPAGNRLFMGLSFIGNDSSIVVLRNLGSADLSVELEIDAASTVELSDAFGNTEILPVRDGRLKLTVGSLPCYLRVAPMTEVKPVKLDFGRNMGPDATIAWSGSTKSDMAILNNGTLEVTHAGAPWGPYWAGVLPDAIAPATQPTTRPVLDLTFASPRPINRVIVHSMRADNPHCALLDFDVQAFVNGQWKTVKQVRTPCPVSDPVRTPDSFANTWYMDQNVALAEFDAVTTDKLRIIPLRATQGFMPDNEAVQYSGWRPGGGTLHLREIEVYGPHPAIELTAVAAAPVKYSLFDKEPVRIELVNRTDRRIDGTIKAIVPEGWKADPPQIALAANGSSIGRGEIKVVAPLDLPPGRVPLRFDLVDRKGKLIGYTSEALTIMPPGPIRTWHLVGPFPNAAGAGFDAVYAPERKVDLDKDVPIPGGKPTRWKQAHTDAAGFMNLVPQFNPHEDVAIYGVIYVRSPDAHKATLSVGSDDGCKVWFNGKRLIANNVARGAAPGQEKVEVEVKSGWNEILIKVTQGGGDCGFYADLLGADGQSMKDLVYTPRKIERP